MPLFNMKNTSALCHHPPRRHYEAIQTASLRYANLSACCTNGRGLYAQNAVTVLLKEFLPAAKGVACNELQVPPALLAACIGAPWLCTYQHAPVICASASPDLPVYDRRHVIPARACKELFTLGQPTAGAMAKTLCGCAAGAEAPHRPAQAEVACCFSATVRRRACCASARCVDGRALGGVAPLRSCVTSAATSACTTPQLVVCSGFLACWRLLLGSLGACT